MEAKWSDYPSWVPTVLDEVFFDLFSNSEEPIRHDLPDSLLWIDSLFPLDTVTGHNEGIDDNCYSTTTEDAKFSMFLSGEEELFPNQDAAGLAAFGFSGIEYSRNTAHSSPLSSCPTQSAETGLNEVPFGAHLYEFEGGPIQLHQGGSVDASRSTEGKKSTNFARLVHAFGVS